MEKELIKLETDPVQRRSLISSLLKKIEEWFNRFRSYR